MAFVSFHGVVESFTPHAFSLVEHIRGPWEHSLIMRDRDREIMRHVLFLKAVGFDH